MPDFYWLIIWEPFAESAFSQIKLIVRSSTKVLLKTGAVVEEGAVRWVPQAYYTRAV